MTSRSARKAACVRPTGRHWLALPLLLATVACGAPPSVMLRLSGTPGDALVTVNDRYIDKLGRVSQRGIKLPPGSYRLTVEQVGFFPHDEIVEIEADKPRQLKVQLQPIPE